MEITRSYSRKLNLGNYETCDFFASAKLEIENITESEKVSKDLDVFVQGEVNKSIKEYLGPKVVDTTLGEQWQKTYNATSKAEDERQTRIE